MGKSNQDVDIITLGRKLLNLWDKEILLGFLATPFAVIFVNWMFRQDDKSWDALKFFAVLIAIVSFGSVIRHIVGTLLKGYYGNKKYVEQNEHEVKMKELEIEDKKISEEIEDKKHVRGTRKSEKHFQMVQIQNSSQITLGLAAGIQEELAIHLEQAEVKDSNIIKSIVRMTRSAREQLYKLAMANELPHKEFIREFYGLGDENPASSDNVPSTPSEIEEGIIQESTIDGEEKLEANDVGINLTHDEVAEDSKTIHESYEPIDTEKTLPSTE